MLNYSKEEKKGRKNKIRKFLKSAMALVLAGALLTSNTGYAQAAQEQAADTIIKSVVSETVFALQAAGKQQSKAVVQAKTWILGIHNEKTSV